MSDYTGAPGSPAMKKILEWDGDLTNMPRGLQEASLASPIIHNALELYDRNDDVTVIGALTLAALQLQEKEEELTNKIVNASMAPPATFYNIGSDDE